MLQLGILEQIFESTGMSHLSQEHGREDHREERLHGFDCMSEWNCNFAKAHIREEIA